MNYKNETLRTLKTLAEQCPTYSLGDLLFACFQKAAVKNKQSISFLREMSDEDAYSFVEKALKEESEE